MSKSNRQGSRGSVVIVACTIVAILLLISILLLLFLPKNEHGNNFYETLFGGSGKNLITLNDQDSTGNAHFIATNMLPGDSATKTYTVNINHPGIKAVSFVTRMGAVSHLDTEKMQVRIETDSEEEPLYEGSVVSMPDRVRVERDTDIEQVVFNVTLLLDTAAGNEFQDKELEFWFQWWVDEADFDASTVDTEMTDKCVPWCFTLCPWCWVIPLLLAIALLLTIIIAIAWAIFRARKIRNARVTGRPIGAGELGLAALFGAMGILASVAINKSQNNSHNKAKKVKSPRPKRKGK